MKRPPGLWFLLSAGVLWLSLQDVYGIRATALIFGRSSTTTTTTKSPSETPLEEEVATSTEPSSSTELSNVTKPTLTGVPQIDYIYEPNLPKELNGYNLSDYPFYERVPEEIDFKCDGLHDGFYASVPHKCQVYHHCLFGTRFDFLCANYTAFDQKTFICHFVSEVDCENSKKFWHRNDALYVAQSTTTLRPLNLNIYTTPPAEGNPITPLSSGTGVARRPAGGRRPYRPNRRRRPQFEYYDDEYEDDEYYEERPRSNRGRKRPRPRPRPAYDDEEYDDYEDERYEKRGGNRRDPDRRRPHESRRTESRKRNKDRRKPEYDDDVDEEVDERFEDADFVKGSRRKGDRRPSEKRRPIIEDYEPEVVERKPARKNKRPPPDSEEYDEEPEADTRREKPPRKSDRHKPVKDESKTSSKEADRPIIKPVSGSIYDRPRVAPRINLPVPKNAADKFSYHTAAVKTVSTTPAKLADEEYYDDYEEEPLPPPKRSKYNNRKSPPPSDSAETALKQSSDSDSKESSKSPTVSAARERNRRPDNSDESVEKPSRPKYGGTRSKYVPARTTTPSSKRPIRPVSEEYYDEYEDEEPIKEPKSASKISKKERPTSTTTTTTTTSTTAPSTTTSTTTTTTTTPPSSEGSPRDKHEPVIRIVKRPFLPSRGGNPYSARGLQPVGIKAFDKPSEQDTSATNSEHSPSEEKRLTKTSAPVEEENKSIEKTQFIDSPQEPKDKIEVFKASPVIIKVPIRSKFVPPEVQEEFSIEPSRPLSEVRQNQNNNYKYQEFAGPRTTQKPKVLVEKNPLDLNEYDVTLNEALNPTLPNLPVRGFPTGFSSANDYTYSSYSRPRYDSVNSASDSDYVYQNPSSSRHHQPQPHAQRYQTLNFRREAHVPSRTQAIYSSYS